MDAGIIAVGSELLTPLRVDTNSLAITERLNAIGIDVRFKAVSGDNVVELMAVLRHALDSAIVEKIRSRFLRRGLQMAEINKRQALVPRGAVVLDNPNGTAPGLWMD